jgi:hypothetical protein
MKRNLLLRVVASVLVLIAAGCAHVNNLGWSPGVPIVGQPQPGGPPGFGQIQVVPAADSPQPLTNQTTWTYPGQTNPLPVPGTSGNIFPSTKTVTFTNQGVSPSSWTAPNVRLTAGKVTTVTISLVPGSNK